MELHHVAFSVFDCEAFTKLLVRGYGCEIFATKFCENNQLTSVVVKFADSLFCINQGINISQCPSHDPRFCMPNCNFCKRTAQHLFDLKLLNQCTDEVSGSYEDSSGQEPASPLQCAYDIAFLCSDSVTVETIQKDGPGHYFDLTLGPDVLGKSKTKITRIKSCVGNVWHSFIHQGYDGVFLPGYDKFDSRSSAFDLFEDVVYPDVVCSTVFKSLGSIDHIAFCVQPGESFPVIKWYEDALGMKRLLVNSEDTVSDGLALECIGMRMTAMQYWMCSEQGVTLKMPSGKKFLIVFTEPLPNAGPNQVRTFLREHRGPGIQHIALSTPNIMSSAACLEAAGANFVKQPAEYYTEVEKQREFARLGVSSELLKTSGILLDMEVDPQDSGTQEHRYLMQVFTRPVFDRNTFFLELIQREGSNGFGAGNVIALFNALERHLTAKQGTEQ